MPAKPPPDYERREQEQWKENAAEVPNELKANSKRLTNRIIAFARRFGFRKVDLTSKVGVDAMFAAQFAKEPRRTGMHEAMAAEWIKELPTVRAFVKLPKSGKNAVYITGEGNITKMKKGEQRPGKSLDFQWESGGITCYAMHKYTKEGGGNQDSQHGEMVEILKRFRGCPNRKCALFVIVDGPYYRGRKLDELTNHVRDRAPRSYVIPIEALPEILQGMGT